MSPVSPSSRPSEALLTCTATPSRSKFSTFDSAQILPLTFFAEPTSLRLRTSRVPSTSSPTRTSTMFALSSRPTVTTPSSRVSTLAVARSLTLRELALTSPRVPPTATAARAAASPGPLTPALLAPSRSPVPPVSSVPSPSSSASFKWSIWIDYAPSMWARQHSYTQLHFG